MTSMPRYVPHVGQTRCVRFIFLQVEQMVKGWRRSARWLRRRFLAALPVRRFGSGVTFVYLLNIEREAQYIMTLFRHVL